MDEGVAWEVSADARCGAGAKAQTRFSGHRSMTARSSKARVIARLAAKRR
jgi:hypothetical protein